MDKDEKNATFKEGGEEAIYGRLLQFDNKV